MRTLPQSWSFAELPTGIGLLGGLPNFDIYKWQRFLNRQVPFY